MLSLHGRTLLIDNGGDVVLGLLTVWTTFLPTGRFFSVDAVYPWWEFWWWPFEIRWSRLAMGVH